MCQVSYLSCKYQLTSLRLQVSRKKYLPIYFILHTWVKKLRIWKSAWQEQRTLVSVSHKSSDTAKSGLSTESWKLYNRNYHAPTLVKKQTNICVFFWSRVPYQGRHLITNMVNLGIFFKGEKGTPTFSKFDLGKCWVKPTEPGSLDSQCPCLPEKQQNFSTCPLVQGNS